MNNSDLSVFLASIKDDDAIRQQLQQAESVEELITLVGRLANDRGLDFSEEEIKQGIQTISNTELNEENLDMVRGGFGGDSDTLECWTALCRNV